MRTVRVLAPGGALPASTALTGCDPAPQPWLPDQVSVGIDATGGASGIVFSDDDRGRGRQLDGADPAPGNDLVVVESTAGPG